MNRKGVLEFRSKLIDDSVHAAGTVGTSMQQKLIHLSRYDVVISARLVNTATISLDQRRLDRCLLFIT